MSSNLTDLSDQQVKDLKKKFTEWGLLDPALMKGDPRVRVKQMPEHSANWHGLCVAAYEKFLKLFGQEDPEGDGTPSEKEYDFIMSKGNPPELSWDDAKGKAIASLYPEKDWFIARGTDVWNVLWIEDIDRNWNAIDGKLDEWDDSVILFKCQHNGKITVEPENFYWQVTTEPGKYYSLVRTLNPKGAARIAFGQYKAYTIGIHGGGRSAHEGFREGLPIRVHRDTNKDGKRDNDMTMDGVYWCNWHTTVGSPAQIGRWSAGCSVFRYPNQFNEFKSKLKQDRRYINSRGYSFMGGYVQGAEFISLMK